MPANTKIAPPGYYMLFAVDNMGSGVPSVAKIIRLRDHEPLGPYDLDLVTGGSGSGNTSNKVIMTACNDYYDGGVTSTNVSGTHTVEIEVQHYGNLYYDVKEIRAHVECKTSANTTLEVFVKGDSGSGTWESWGTQAITSTETLTEKLRTFGTATSEYFDTYDPFKMHTKLKWTSSSSFTVYLDAFEMAVKP